MSNQTLLNARLRIKTNSLEKISQQTQKRATM